MTKRLILCIDLGSSSVRCSLFEWGETVRPFRLDDTATSSSSSASQSWEAVREGKILWWQNTATDADNQPLCLLDLVDQCMDQVLGGKMLAAATTTSSKDDDAPQIVAVGFSSLVMNLVGVDRDGQVVPEATLSYACNDATVAQKVKELER